MNLLKLCEPSFLNPSLCQVEDWSTLPDIEKAVGYVKVAHKHAKKVCIYGDYDVDGITGSAILFHTLKRIGVHVSCVIPNREDGYGLNHERVPVEADLVITVDNGVSANAHVEALKDSGKHTIVTDHHQFGEVLPDTTIVHPGIPSSKHGNKDLCGSAVAFKFAWALCDNFGVEQDFLFNLFGLAAMGTIADVVDVSGENRSIIVNGLLALECCDLPGVRVLIRKCGLSAIDQDDVGYKMGPRINAPGRMGKAEKGFELLTCDSDVRAEELFEEIEVLNAQRKELQERCTNEALSRVKMKGKKHGIVLKAKDWPLGIIGIVAAKVSETHGVPAVIIHEGEEFLHASCRAPANFDLVKALRKSESLLEKYGGHAQAAGLTLTKKNYAKFVEAFEKCTS